MKPNYKNWVPKGMVVSMIVGTIITGIIFAVLLFSDLMAGTAYLVVNIILGVLFLGLLLSSICVIFWYQSFSYNGNKKFAQRIIKKIAEYVVLPKDGKGLDIGCGSGALTIACAKNNPEGKMIGLDRWGKEYASFTKGLCESNAEIEGVAKNITFVKGDACKLDFPDNSFDAVTSNYCYHNILVKGRQELLLETLRVLKKGGTFAIHDIFTKSRYGDMDKFLKKLKDMGFEKAELLDTANGKFMTKKEARALCLTGSKLLVGKK